ncbi:MULTISPECIES: NAD(P)-binding domain-containing protein [unclassified Adlercreutzia]|uniref:NAD(P)-binding domain-containing protein n=1 Tax=unclassified Adlercreutzia TaxID=2636013 RepID=UPI0013EC892B|nr:MULTISPECIES: NAD(P)-binding domain-containing protein [unclassified Adlercreutzia]
MAQSYAYRGSEGFVDAVAGRLEAAGLARTAEVAAADVVITFCTSQSALEDLYFGEGGVIQSAMPGALLIDLSATTPSFAREMSAVATVSDLALVEAPLVVADVAAVDALARENAACFAAGEADAVAQARPVLEALFGQVSEEGSPGSAQLARAAYTLQLAAQVIGAVEADALFRATRRSVSCGNAGAGEQPGGASPAAAQVLEAVAAERFTGAYNAEMLMSALSAAIMAADDVELILPQAEAALHLLELLAVVGGADKSPAALSLVYGDESECAKHGLDWTRAEEVYGTGKHDDEDDYAFEDDGCGCGHDHEHRYDDYEGYDLDDPYGTFSNN